MNEELQTLSKLFTERLFRIPDYQRGYAWGKDQLEDFWQDLNQIEDGRNHYTGVLTLENVPKEAANSWEEDRWIIESKSFSPFYVVDGQQRLTTSIILVSCIVATLEHPEDELNYTPKREIEQRYLFQSKNGGASRSYIFGYERDNPSYEYLKTEIFGEQSASARHEETVYTNNLHVAQQFFNEQLNTLNKSDIEDLYRKVTQRLLFNVFSISEEVDVCVAFETMNNRGKPLSHLELLKNRLIYLTTRVNVPESESRDLRRTINESWKTVYHNLGRNKEAPLDDDFFLRSHHFLNFIDPAPEKLETDDDRRQIRRIVRAAEEPLYRDLLNDIFTFGSILNNRKSEGGSDSSTVERIHQYSVSLQEAVKLWYQIFNPAQTNDESNYNYWLGKINRISTHTIYPVVLSVMLATKDNTVRTNALSAIERLLFLDFLTTRYYRFQPTTMHMLNTAIKINRGEATVQNLIDVVNERTSQILESEGGQKEIKESLKSRNFYTWRPTHYLLYEYNLFLQKKSKTERDKIDWDTFIENETDYESIEHIYPQTARGKYWTERFKGLTPANRDLLKNVVGNLLPLSRPKNSSLSNKSFPEKVGGTKTGVGFIYGSYAENEVVALYDEWTPRSVLDRSLRILDFMEERWGIDFGKDSEKISMLGLGFIKPATRINAPKKVATRGASKSAKKSID